VASRASCSTCGWEWWSGEALIWTAEDAALTHEVLRRQADEVAQNHRLAFRVLDTALNDIEYYRKVIPGLDTFLPGSGKRQS
jgi:hypothetical protein